MKAYIHITGDNLFIKSMDTLEDIIKQVIIDIREKKKKKPDSNLILREAEVKHGLNYKTAKGVLDQMVQDNKIIVNTENSHFINNKSHSTSESDVSEIHGSSDLGVILQHTQPTTNASGKEFEVMNESSSQEGGSFSTSYPLNALTAQITSLGKMADTLIELNRLLQEERSKNLILMEENYSLKLKLRADAVNSSELQTAIVPVEIPNNSATVQPLCVSEQSPSNKKTQLLKSKKIKQKKSKGKQANKTEAPLIKDIGNCNAAQNATTQIPKSASSAPSGSASSTTDATGNKENNPANDIPQNESQVPGGWRKNTALVLGDSMVSNINEKTLSRKFHMKVRSFPGANTRDLQDYVKPLIRKRPDKIIIVIGTNDIERKPVNDILRSIKLVMDMILEKLPDCHLVISEIIRRADNRLNDAELAKLNGKINTFNQSLKKINIDILRQQNIIRDHLGRDGLHLNFNSNKQLALNIIEKLRSFKH